MPDYVSILNRSIATRQADTPDKRQAVYETARAALARQLTAVDPPFADAEIEAQYQKLEDAVAEVEAAHALDEGAFHEEEPEPEPGPPARVQEAPAARGPILRRESAGARRQEEAQAPPATPSAAPAAAPAASLVRPPSEPEPLEDEEPMAEAAVHDDVPPDARPTRAPISILFLLLALVVAGAGALAYTQWDTLEAALTDLRGEREVVAVPPKGDLSPPRTDAPAVAAAPAAGDEGQKGEDRLVGDAAPAAGTAETAQEPANQPGLDEGETETAALDPEAGEGAPAPAAPEVGDQAALPQAVSPTGEPADQPAASGPAGQRAILYEQGQGGAPGRASQGSVAWQQTRTPDDQPGLQARVQLPDQKVTVTVTISKNTDAALPASHLIEVAFDQPANFGASEIERVPALVIKASEEARGEALVGVAVRVEEGLFWIALPAEDAQAQRNLELLTKGEWFELPILFKDGRRALITFEKGAEDAKLFRTVLAGQ